MYNLILAVIFFSSFVFSIINISVNETSIYFFLFVPLLDVSFLRDFFCKKYSLLAVIIFLLLCFFSVAINALNLNILGLIKPFLMFLSVCYIYYVYNNRYAHFKLIYYFSIVSVVFACFQFVVTYVTGSELVQPFYLARLIWGKYGIQARPGFDDGLLFPFRVSGLSKEPGFFSSFLLSLLMFYFYDDKFRSRIFIFSIILGIILSLSKITLAFAAILPLIIFVDKFVFRLDRLPLIVGVTLLVSSITLLTVLLYNVTSFIDLSYASPWIAETYLHRSIGWYVLYDFVNIELLPYFIFGGITEHLNAIVSLYPFLSNLRFVYTQPNIVFFSSNHAYVILQYGVLFFTTLICFLQQLRVSFSSFIVFTVLISNVNMFAFENWVVLGFVYMLRRRDKTESAIHK